MRFANAKNVHLLARAFLLFLLEALFFHNPFVQRENKDIFRTSLGVRAKHTRFESPRPVIGTLKIEAQCVGRKIPHESGSWQFIHTSPKPETAQMSVDSRMDTVCGILDSSEKAIYCYQQLECLPETLCSSESQTKEENILMIL